MRKLAHLNYVELVLDATASASCFSENSYVLIKVNNVSGIQLEMSWISLFA